MNSLSQYQDLKGESVITRDSRNILIADDSLFFRTKLSDILVEAGHKVRFATNGKEVIDEVKIDASNIDLLVLDLQMPGLDGFGVLEWLSENALKDSLPVLVITSVYEPTHVLERLKELGAIGLVTKGFPPEQLIFRVNRALYPDKVAQSMRPTERVSVSAPVDFTMGETTRTGYILNISEKGVYIHTTEPLMPESEVNMKFTLPGHDRVFNIDGKVTRVTENTPKKKLFTGCGVMFTSVDPNDQTALKDFISAEIKRQGLHR